MEPLDVEQERTFVNLVALAVGSDWLVIPPGVFIPDILFDLVSDGPTVRHVDHGQASLASLIDDVHGFFVLRFAHLRVLLPSVLAGFPL